MALLCAEHHCVYTESLFKSSFIFLWVATPLDVLQHGWMESRHVCHMNIFN